MKLDFRIVAICCFAFFSLTTNAQEIPPSVRQQIESFIEEQETDDLDIYELFEKLSNYIDKPFDINSRDFETLTELRLLSDIQIFQLEQHLNQFGPLLDIYELQSIPSFDRATIERLSLFITVADTEKYQVKFKDMLTKGNNELFLKWRRVLEEQKGYIKNDDGESAYVGDPNRLFVKYKYNYESRFRYGFTLEKDSGEEFFTGSNSKGFDFMSGYAYMKDYSTFLKDIIVGDYNISMGQGMIVHNSFGSGKSAWVTDIKRGGRVLKPYNSVSENRYFRGIGATIRPIGNLELSLFGSLTKKDGAIDTFDFEDQALVITSINESGFHRTASELERKRDISATAFGGVLKYKGDNFYLGFNYLQQSFNKDYKLGGTFLQNTSADYSYRLRNIHFFGEAAYYVQTKSWANVHGCLMGLGKKAGLALLYRNYNTFYGTLYPNGFGETSTNQNEKGFYLGIELYPSNQWKIRLYGDVWKNPWLRFRVDKPSNGREYLLRIDYTKKRRFTVYTQLRFERKDRNFSNAENDAFNPDSRFKTIKPAELWRFRLHLNNKVTKALELRSRVEFSRFNHATDETGIIAFQDIIYKPLASKLSFTARYAIFSIQDFDARIYTYENDILYEFFIPAFANTTGNGNGTRFYTNVRAKLTRSITAEFRYAKTYLQNAESISSGNEAIEGDTRTELKAQLKFKF